MSSHSKGPWSVGLTRPQNEAGIIETPILSADGAVVALVVGYRDNIRNANAALAAEAPALLQIAVAYHRVLSGMNLSSESPFSAMRERIADVVTRAGGEL